MKGYKISNGLVTIYAPFNSYEDAVEFCKTYRDGSYIAYDEFILLDIEI